MELLLATANQNKVRELEKMLQGVSLQLKSLADFPDYQAPPEDGESFLANATCKAVAAAEHSGLLTLADDSGLQVDFLQGAPGVHSARYAGKEHDDKANNRKLLTALEGVPQEKRQAQFVCVVVVAAPNGQFFYTQGSCKGEIAFSESGEGGFGYDPLFYLPNFGCSMAELSASEKNRISHRGQALAQMVPLLKKVVED